MHIYKGRDLDWKSWQILPETLFQVFGPPFNKCKILSRICPSQWVRDLQYSPRFAMFSIKVLSAKSDETLSSLFVPTTSNNELTRTENLYILMKLLSIYMRSLGKCPVNQFYAWSKFQSGCFIIFNLLMSLNPNQSGYRNSRIPNTYIHLRTWYSWDLISKYLPPWKLKRDFAELNESKEVH